MSEIQLDVLKRCAEVTSFNPDSEAEEFLARGTLWLLAEVDRLTVDNKAKSDACQTLGRIIEMYGNWVVEATDSQDLIGEDGDGDWEIVWDRLTEMKAELVRLRAATKEDRSA